MEGHTTQPAPENVPGAPPAHPRPKPVPDDLLHKLHEANQRLHESKEHLERQMEGTEFRHQQRVDEAGGRFQAAEREVEEVAREIEAFIEGQPGGGA